MLRSRIGYGFENSQRHNVTERVPDALSAPLPARTAQAMPSPLDPWLDRNAQEDYEREAEGGMRVVGFGLLFVSVLLIGVIVYGAMYL